MGWRQLKDSCAAHRILSYDLMKMKRPPQSQTSKVMRRVGRAGRKIAHERISKMTPEERSEEMRRVARARYAKKESEPDGGAGISAKRVGGAEVPLQGL